MRLGEIEACLPEPAISYRGRHFYRHTFSDLPSGKDLTIDVGQDAAAPTRTLRAQTLPPLPGVRKMRLGLLADLHLTLQRGHIDDYRPGTKRLCGLSLELTERYLDRLERLGAEAIVLLGDVVDPCTRESLAVLRNLLARCKVPCYPIIGNHEPWSRDGADLFHEALGLPQGGYYAVCRPGLRLLLLSTPSPDALHPDRAQYRWLVEQLGDAKPDEDIVLFSHFSLVLHRCVQGTRNDGYQLLDAHRELLDLIRRCANVRLVSAGHKNVPSRFLSGHVLHLLSPQLIQAPCGYDLLDLCADGLARITYEIDEQHYAEVARAAYEREGPLRFGTDEDRCFVWRYPQK
jgi:3',5'-cyclic AMP phosphodiesterase CpdA